MSSVAGSDSSTPQVDELHSHYCDSDADITFRSLDGMLFRTHSLILKLASDVFAGMVSMPREQVTESEVVQLTEEADILCGLFDSIYPRRAPPDLSSMEFVSRLAVAADKYDIIDVTNRIRKGILRSSSSFAGSSLEQYALAGRFGWDEEARFVSQFITSPKSDGLFEKPTLESMDAMSHVKLLTLHRRRYLLLSSISISYQANLPEESRNRNLRWEFLSGSHAPSCRSQHHNKNTWAVFKAVALTELEKLSPAECVDRFNTAAVGTMAGLWEDTCSKCHQSFFLQGIFEIEFKRILRLLPTTIG